MARERAQLSQQFELNIYWWRRTNIRWDGNLALREDFGERSSVRNGSMTVLYPLFELKRLVCRDRTVKLVDGKVERDDRSERYRCQILPRSANQ
jgi:hypothetical protein